MYYFGESGFTGVLKIPYAWQDENEQLLLPSGKTSRINVLGFLNKRAVGQTYSYHQQNPETKILTGSRLSVTESYKDQQV